MTRKNEKGLRPWLIKSVAVFIGISYLMVPMQHGLTEVMHLLSHSMDQGVEQHTTAAHTHKFNHQHTPFEVVAAHSFNATKIHTHTMEKDMGSDDHDHPHQSDFHQHEIIDFMAMAFSASTSNHEGNEQMAVQPDLDKHLVLGAYHFIRPVQGFKKLYFSNIKGNTSKGILHLLVPPPKPLC